MMFHTNNYIPLGILDPPPIIYIQKSKYKDYARYIVYRRRSLTNFLSELFCILSSYLGITTDYRYSAVRKGADPLVTFDFS
jgi:hypothetical protein